MMEPFHCHTMTVKRLRSGSMPPLSNFWSSSRTLLLLQLLLLLSNRPSSMFATAFSVRPQLTTTTTQRLPHPPLHVAAADRTDIALETEELIVLVDRNPEGSGTVSSDDNNNNNHSLLTHLQTRAAPIVQSFRPESFDPVPWLSNRHIQTIGGFLVRGTKLAYLPKEENDDGRATTAVWNTCERVLREWNQSVFSKTATVDKNHPDDPPDFWDDRERIVTRDNDNPADWFHADCKYSRTDDGAIRPDAPVVLLLHGLEANSESGNCMEMATSFNRQGMHCVCLNFRGCSGTPNDTLGAYHLGFTDDVKLYLEILAQRQGAAGAVQSSGRPPVVYLAGFSLGANAALKCLGELGADAVTKWNIAGAAVACAPLDQERNSATLGRPGINRSIYTRFLLKSLQNKAVEKWESFCQGNEDTEAFDYKGAMAAKTISEFDTAFIAPIYGFDDCHDYYKQTSSVFFLDQIAVPTLLLNAYDDPFFDPSVWPVEKSVDHGGSLPLKMVRMDNGGHLGFFFHQVKDADDVRLTSDEFHPSWAASELGRFLGHVQSHGNSQRTETVQQ